MKTVQLVKYKNKNWEYVVEKQDLIEPLVLVFGNRFMLEEKTVYQELRQIFPDGHIVFASSCAEISSNTVNQNSITVTAIEFEKTAFQIETSNLLTSDVDSFKTGEAVVRVLKSVSATLKHAVANFDTRLFILKYPLP